jgi:hypothetical protein
MLPFTNLCVRKKKAKMNNPAFQKNIVLTTTSTGSGTQVPNMHVIDYPIGNVVLKIALSPMNTFLGVIEISSQTDFRSSSQRIQSPNFHDVESYYKE